MMRINITKDAPPVERRVRFGNPRRKTVAPAPRFTPGVVEHDGGKFFVLREGVSDTFTLCVPGADGGLIDTGEKTTVPGEAKFLPLAANTKVDSGKVLPFQAQPSFATTEKVAIMEGDKITDYLDVKIMGLASDFALDRDHEMIKPGAYRKTLEQFQKNPVMLTDHANKTAHVVGSYSQIREDANGLHVEGLLSNAPDEFTTRIRFLVAEKHLKAFSVGGLMRYNATDYSLIEEVDLFEISLVPIPANPRSLLTTMSMNIEVAKKSFNYGYSQN